MTMATENFPILGTKDIEALLQDNSGQAQLQVVEKLTHQYTANDDAPHLAEKEKSLAEDIFRLLMKNAETHVRAALSNNLKASADVPHDIVISMARDVEEVSLPVLQFSDVLSEADLLDIIRTSDDEARHIAIAARHVVPENISEALVNTGREAVVTTLVKNEGAQIADHTFEKIVEHHAASEAIVHSMIERGSLPIAVADKLMEKVSGTIRGQLKEKYGAAFDAAHLNKVVEQSLEVATLKLMGLKTPDTELSQLLKHLGETGKLSPFTALCVGDLHLFEVSMSRLAKVPLKNVRILLHEKGEAGFIGLYEKADLPESIAAAVRLAIKAMVALEEGYAHSNIKALRFSTVEIMEKMLELQGAEDVPNMQYLLTMMQHHVRV